MLQFLRKQTRLTIFVEFLFALLLVMTFLASQGGGLSLRALARQDASEPHAPSIERPDNLEQPVAMAEPPDVRGGPVADPDALSGLACRELIVNGDFERFGAWQMPVTPRPASLSGERAFSGQRSLKLGSDVNDREDVAGDSIAMQTLSLPDDAEQILLRAQIWQGGSDDSDRQYLRLENDEETITVFEEQADHGTWQSLSYNLTNLRGQSIDIVFGAYNNGEGDKSVLYVDSVSVSACSSSPSAAGQEPSQDRTLTDTPSLSQTDTLHLPLITGSKEEATPTASPVVEEVALCSPLLVNGGFEENAGWTTPITNGQARYSTEQAFAGERSMRLGLPENVPDLRTDSTAYQSLQLPQLPHEQDQLTLRAQVWRNGVVGEGDFQYIWVIVGNTTYRIFQNLADTNGWQPVSFDLTPFAGRRVLIFLGTYNNGSGSKASMYVDEIQVDLCEAGQPSVTSAPTTEPTATPSATPTPDYAPPATVLSPDFGVNAFLWWRPEIADRDLDLVAEAGFNWVRQSFDWEDIETEDGVYQWDTADRVVQHVNRQGLNLLARLGSDPDLESFWAGRPPDSLDAFVEYVAAVAARYNCTSSAVGCIQAYQIWNEPNLAREWGGNRPSPSAYLSMLADAYSAIKAANPNAIVISAGMAPTGTDNQIAMPDQRFYQEMYRLMQGDSEGYFDMLGVHAAGFAAPPELSPAQAASNPEYGGQRFFAFRHVEDIRAIMEAYGDDETRIAILEFGWTSDAYNEDYIWFGAGAGIDEFVKADYLVRAYAFAEANWQPWIGLMSVLTMPDLDWIADGNPFDEEQYWWAIMEPSTIDELRFRPAYVALCEYINQQQGEVCPYAP